MVQRHFITMNLTLNEPEKQLQLNIENSTNGAANTTVSGIGLANVKRRLNLVYPNKHTLHIYETPTNFKVDLTINLS